MQCNKISQCLRYKALTCLKEKNPQIKLQLTYDLYHELEAGLVIIDDVMRVDSPCVAGFPEKPELVPAYKLPKRRIASKEGHAALIHSFAHIEFNAVNIAWDAVYRFSAMPKQFYLDWARIAKEEAYHFQLLDDYLRELGYQYGSFQAHDDLWNMVNNTSHDVMVRMALVPRVLEARGLDVTPEIIRKFKHHNYPRAAEILEIIYRDEIGHVDVGSHWFKQLCEKRGLNPTDTFEKLIREYATDKIKKPFNEFARTKAGFTQSEMELLNTWVK